MTAHQQMEGWTHTALGRYTREDGVQVVRVALEPDAEWIIRDMGRETYGFRTATEARCEADRNVPRRRTSQTERLREANDRLAERIDELEERLAALEPEPEPEPEEPSALEVSCAVADEDRLIVEWAGDRLYIQTTDRYVEVGPAVYLTAEDLDRLREFFGA